MSNSYQIDRVLDETIIEEKPHYLIKWKGFSSTESTWEPIENLLDELDLVHSWKVKNSPSLAKRLRNKSKNTHSSQMEPEMQQQKLSMDYGRKKKQKRRKLTIDDSNSSNNSSNQFVFQQTDELSFCQNMRVQRNRLRKSKISAQKRLQRKNTNSVNESGETDFNGFKKVGKVTKQGLKSILLCFDWEGDHFCQVLLKDGRKVHMRKEDVKKICPQILFEYYEKIERNHL